jgi:hypothetical protein
MAEEVTPPVTPPATPPADNFTQLRAQANQLENDLKKEREARQAADQKLLEIERLKLDDVKRLELEKQDLDNKVKELEPLKARIEANDNFFKGMYERELATLPVEIQENARKLTEGANSESQRLDMLTLFKASIPAPAPAPLRAGSPNNVQLPGSVPVLHSPPPEVAPADWDKLPEGGFVKLVKEAAVPGGVQKPILVDSTPPLNK